MSVFFSIITVCKNDPEGLARTINSVGSQTYKSYEQLIKDNSDYSVSSIIDNSQNRRVRLLQGQDFSTYDAMNRALYEAKGEWTVFLNSGDTFVDDQVLMKVRQFIDTQDTKWLYGGLVYESSDGRRITRVSLVHPSQVFFGRTFFPHPATFMKTEFILECGDFDTTLKVAADQDLLLRAHAASKPASLLMPLVVMRLGGASSRQSVLSRELEFRKIRLKHFNYALGNSRSDFLVTIILVAWRCLRNWIRKDGTFADKRRCW